MPGDTPFLLGQGWSEKAPWGSQVGLGGWMRTLRLWLSQVDGGREERCVVREREEHSREVMGVCWDSLPVTGHIRTAHHWI